MGIFAGVFQNTEEDVMKNGEEKLTVRYEDFGAVGDGKNDDFSAIAAAHAYANERGLKVEGKKDATYYIGKDFVHTIYIENDVDFAGASFIIDDSVENAFEFREIALFTFKRTKSLTLDENEIKEKIGENVKISREDREFKWLSPLLEEDSFIRVTNEEHRDFVRFGSNQNNGNPRQDIFIVRKDGTLAESTLPAFEFDKITSVEIFPAEEKPITVKGGNFASICCRASKETEFKNKWRGFWRGFKISRSNVTLEGLTHRMIDEPKFVIDSGMDELSATYAERNESYPYMGFIVTSLANNVTIKDCLLTSHTTYYEDKPATKSTGWKVPKPVPMGSYDYYLLYSNEVSLINVRQECPTGIGDSRYWGIMASNNCKNLHLDGCYVNRFDAHRGFWNATIKNSTIGHSINITGGGDLYMENVTKLMGQNFLYIRNDYGGSFEGNITIKNCHHKALPGYNTSIGKTMKEKPHGESVIINPGGPTKVEDIPLFYDWDFGYELFLPMNVTVEGFTSEADELYLYTSCDNERYNNEHKHAHRLTDAVTYINMEKIPKTAKSDECTELNSIPVTVK